MNRHNSLIALLTAGAASLLGCSTSSVPPVVDVQPVRYVVPAPGAPHNRFDPDGDALPGPDVQLGRVCQLGTSCLELDPRPFEFCLLASGKHCGDKITESLLAVNPEPAEPR